MVEITFYLISALIYVLGLLLAFSGSLGLAQIENATTLPGVTFGDITNPTPRQAAQLRHYGMEFLVLGFFLQLIGFVGMNLSEWLV